MSEFASDLSHMLARKLIAAHRGGQRAPAQVKELEALSRAQALHIQGEVVSALSPVAGWKAAALPDGDLVSAPILRHRLLQSPASLSPVMYGLGGVECEIAFRFARRPTPRKRGFEREDILDALDAACAAVEVVDSRWAVASPIPRNAMIADLLSNGALVVGSFNPHWRSVAFDVLAARLSINGTVRSETRGGHSDCDLIGLLVMLANDLLKRGIMLGAGEIVTTGSFTGFHTATSGDEIKAEFDGFPPVSVIFNSLESNGEANALR
ncbi:MAG: hypothetical protein EOR25_22240 [Mesorhizobium sp.]|uniref:2-keto-4-pentenoate hydratase n=1 Tax=Mesorhizobium sp. TaxID=1871066 RepID=UPI000FE3FA10|nr:fumarylacetoacetate hydrolase family protein [Mesorhizobium sp.]RWJ04423.1 MAG: hypothetical protein EOR24_30485 [Mesorhizobium sp.]RWJ15186.1 MAG: hypothetical protein EOR25_22240 [Mesorhizobium sp.]